MNNDDISQQRYHGFYIQEEVYQEIIHVLGTDLTNEPSHEHFTQMPLLDR